VFGTDAEMPLDQGGQVAGTVVRTALGLPDSYRCIPSSGARSLSSDQTLELEPWVRAELIVWPAPWP